MMQSKASLSPFVGRADEMEALLSLACSPRGTVVVVGGEAGVGKTRLLSEFAEAVKGKYLLATSVCVEYARSPLYPILNLLDHLRAQRPDVLAKHTRVRVVLDRLNEARVLGQFDTSRDDRLMLFQTLEEALSLFAARDALVLLIEDVQWADDSTTALLLHLTASLSAKPVMLVITHRTERRAGHDPSASFISRIARFSNVQRLMLPSLDERDIDAIVRHHLGGTAERERRAEICKRAEGNALFAEELAKHVLASRENRSREAGLPQTIADAIRSRLEVLPFGERSMLLAAAVIGRSFDAELLAAIAGAPRDRVLRVLREARDSDLIAEDAPPCFSFKHALIQEAMYGELLTMERQMLHANILEELLQRPGSDINALAYHAWAARNNELSLRYNELAGDSACQAGAWIEACEYYERAAESTHEPALSSAIYAKLGRALERAGFEDRALRAFARSMDMYERQYDSQAVASMCLAMFEILSALGEDETGLSYLQRARDTLAGDTTGPSYLLAVLYTAHLELWGGEVDSGVRRLEEIAQDARSHEDADVRSRYYATLADAHLVRRDYERSIDAQKRAVEVTPRTHERRLEHVARLAELYGVCANVPAAGHIYAEAAELALERRDAVKAALYRMCREEMLLMQGLTHQPTLRAELEIAQALALRTNAPLLALQAARVAIFFSDGQIDAEFASFVDRLIAALDIEERFRFSTNEQFFRLTGAFALWLRSKGRTAEASDALDRSVARLSRRRLRSTDWSLCTLVSTAAHGDIAHIPIVHAFLSKSHIALAPSFLPLVEAIEAIRTGRPHDARRPALEAAERLEKNAIRFECALALEFAGETERAIAAFEAAGRPRDVLRLKRSLVPVNRRGRPSNELTDRERQIAELIARGESNRAIADALHITEKTVETHVASIFTRLGVRSRRDVAEHYSRMVPAAR